jgi:polyisoprenoid-binding protein YceI
MTSTLEQQQTTRIPAGTWQADPVHSSVGFEVKYLGVAAYTGDLTGFEASLADGELTGSAEVASVEVKDENLKAHLQSPEFFDAERHPTVRFSGRSTGEGRFEGEITIKGITQPARLEGKITGPVTDPYGNVRYGLSLTTVVDRTTFGLSWNAPLPGGGFALANDVTLKAELSLVKAA